MSPGHVIGVDEQQRIAWIAGSEHRILLDGAATESRLAIFRSFMKGSAASPVHVHHREDETVVILEGEGIFWIGDRRWEATSGDTVFMPRGIPHAYNITSETAEFLTICNPAGMETFYRAVGWDLAEPVPADWAVDLAAMPEAARSGGQEILGPPLNPGDAIPVHLLTDRGAADDAPPRNLQ